MSQTATLPKHLGLQIVYAQQPFPSEMTRGIFLAGPTPRKEADGSTPPSWRPEALDILEELGFTGTVFIPEDGDGQWRNNYNGQIEWEEEGLNRADCIVCWIPREIGKMPAFTTNDEYGTWKYSGKVVFGAPEGAPKVGYQQYYARKLGIPSCTTLRTTLEAAVSRIGAGALRRDGECQVPLYVWQTPSFQEWYKNLRRAGNRLDGARVEWTHRLGENRTKIFFWILHVNVYVASEKRNKTNEVVISRPDISAVVAYRRGKHPLDTEVVLIKEFRSPVLNSKGYVYELPGGSSFNPTMSRERIAAHEWDDETGYPLDTVRFVPAKTRQMLATLSTHNAHLFSVELSENEISALRKLAGVVHGVEEDTERTYVEVKTIGEILEGNEVDWSMLGMILSVVA